MLQPTVRLQWVLPILSGLPASRQITLLRARHAVVLAANSQASEIVTSGGYGYWIWYGGTFANEALTARG